MNTQEMNRAAEIEPTAASSTLKTLEPQSTPNKTIVPDISQARHFLTLLDENNHCFVFETIEEPKPKQRAVSIQRYYGSFETYSELLKKINHGSGVFVAINQTDGKGRKKENVTKIRTFFADLDGSPLESIRQAPLEPHIIVESSPGRYHVYWLIDDAPLDSFESMQKRLAERFGGDPSVCDLPRLMRLPGFLHRKHTPYQSRILETSATLPYSFEKFQDAFGTINLELNIQPAPQEQTHTSPLDSSTLTRLRELGLIKRLEHEGEGRWAIRCPWAHEHTTGDDAYYFSKSNPGYKGTEGFQCFHVHCKDRNISTLRFFLGLSPIAGIDPLPLFREIGAPPVFPIEALGSTMGQAAIEMHNTIQAPLAVIGQSLLGVASLPDSLLYGMQNLTNRSQGCEAVINRWPCMVEGLPYTC